MNDMFNDVINALLAYIADRALGISCNMCRRDEIIERK